MELQQSQQENFDTIEESDLIEILWMQDIDMGCTKETFSHSMSSIRKELEKDEDYELLKSKCKEDAILTDSTPDLTVLDLPEEIVQESVSNNDEITYIIDVETGELVQAPPGTVLPESPTASAQPMEVDSSQQTTNADPMQMTFEDALSILEAETKNPPVNIIPPVADTSLQTEIDSLVENISQMSGLSYTRQTSIEARWNDVEGFISEEIEADPPAHIAVDPTVIKANHMYSSMEPAHLLQNGINMKIASPQNDTFSLIESLGVAENIVLPITHQVVSQPVVNPNEGVFTRLLASGTAGMETEQTFLDLLTNINQADGTEIMPIKVEDADSAVGSLDSIGTDSLQDFVDTDSSLSSPFDGATIIKGNTEALAKYDPKDQTFNFSTIQWDPSDMSTVQDLGITLASEQKMDDSFSGKSGQSSKDSRKQQREDDRKISRPRDERKAKAMNIPISVEDVIHSPVEKFNELLTNFQLSDSQLQLIKDIRRRGKNKVAAQNCRKRKMEVIETLEECVIRMRREKEQSISLKASLDAQRGQIRDKYSNLYKDIFKNLRDENGKPYNPNEYALQHTPDGNIFLVPKNNSKIDDPQLMQVKKRKGISK